MIEFRQALELSQIHWLDHATRGPILRRSLARMQETAAQLGAPAQRRAQIAQARSTCADLVGVRDREIGFVGCTADAVSTIASGLDLSAEDNVVVVDGSFPAITLPFARLATAGVEIRVVHLSGVENPLDTIVESTDRQTRVIAVSWVQYATGTRLDLSLLSTACRERGIMLVLDVAQALGALELDLGAHHVDVCVGCGHKWLLGPEGVGILYVSDRVVDRITPTRMGRYTIERGSTAADPRWATGATRFETGSGNTPGIVALAESIRQLQAIGLDRIEATLIARTQHLTDRLEQAGFEVAGDHRPASGIRSISTKDTDPRVLVEHLATAGFAVACRGGLLRVSPHFYNTVDELDAFVDALVGCPKT